MFRKVKRYCFRLFHPVIGEVWQLHRISEEKSRQERQRPYEISPRRLESLIVAYLNKGVEFVPLVEVSERMRGKVGKKFVSITLDDGYANNVEIAYPIFQKYNVPFCIFVCEKMITGERREDDIEDYKMLTTEQIQLLDKSPLCSIGGHTSSHFHLTRLSKDQQLMEIDGCKTWLEGILGHGIDSYAFPYGDYNADTLDVLRQVGIKRAVASWGGAVRKNTPNMVLTIPRLLVTETTMQ